MCEKTTEDCIKKHFEAMIANTNRREEGEKGIDLSIEINQALAEASAQAQKTREEDEANFGKISRMPIH